MEGLSGTGGEAYAFDSGSVVSLYQNNRWYNCATGETLAGKVVLAVNNSATTASGLVNAGSANYIPTSELIGAGFQTGFLDLSGNAIEIDIGAIQKVPSGGGGLFRHPGMSGGIIG